MLDFYITWYGFPLHLLHVLTAYSHQFQCISKAPTYNPSPSWLANDIQPIMATSQPTAPLQSLSCRQGIAVTCSFTCTAQHICATSMLSNSLTPASNAEQVHKHSKFWLWWYIFTLHTMILRGELFTTPSPILLPIQGITTLSKTHSATEFCMRTMQVQNAQKSSDLSVWLPVKLCRRWCQLSKHF